MSIHSHMLTSQKSTSTLRAGSASAVLVAFSNRDHRPARIGPVPLASAWGSAKTAERRLAAATDWLAPSGVIIDFARARRNGRAARIREQSPSENRDSVTLADVAVIVYVIAATAFYPALAWLLIGS